MRILPRTLALFVLLSIAACAAPPGRSSDPETRLRDAFSKISLSTHGLDYPMYEKRLADCIARNNKECLKTFNHAMDGKDSLKEQIRLDPERTLRATLKIIFIDPPPEKKIDLDKEKEKERVSISTAFNGAIISLYFFNSEEHDKIILEHAMAASPEIVQRIFCTSYEWQYNRPHPERWIAFVENIPDTVVTVYAKKRIMDTFKETGFEKFGIMLDRPDRLRK